VKMVYVLIAAVVVGAGIGGARSLTASTPYPTAETEPPAADETAAPGHASSVLETESPESPEPSASAAIDGEVLEVLQVPQYTYLRLGEKGAQGTWVAVPTASVEVGARARVGEAMKMTGFTSTTLKRTFPVIYFGTLEGGIVDPSAAGAMSAAHVPLGPVAVKPVDRAPGPNGKTVAELVAQRTALAGKTVRIHATVVKSTPGVLGRTYLHLRDGSGDAALGSHDVAATTEATPAVGDVVLLEGVVAIDRDIGSGYKFPILVENARILSTP